MSEPTWTSSRPTANGFYWYREKGEDPQIIEWDNDLQWLMFTGSDIASGDDTGYPIAGEFWSEPLQPPPL